MVHMPGPKKSPRHLKRLKGTLQRCRDQQPAMPALPLVDEIPEPPAWLSSDAAAEFRRLAAVLHANSRLAAGNILILAHACMIHSRLAAAWVSGATPSGSLLSVYRRMLGDLGLSNLPAPATPQRENRFAELHRRSQERSRPRTMK